MATDIQEALTAAGAAPLVAKRISPVLLEYQRRYAPLVAALPSTKWDSTVYYFNKRVNLPGGGFVTDGGAYNQGNPSTSNYNQENFQIRLLQSIGAVTGYAQAVTTNLIGDLRAREIEGAARGLYWDMETALLWGSEAPTQAGPAPQFDGLDVICSAFSNTTYSTTASLNPGVGGGAIDNWNGVYGASGWGGSTANKWIDGQDQNTINASGGSLALGGLDVLIDLVESNVAEPVENSEWMLLMSPSANSRLSQLLINQQRFVDEVQIASGLIVPTYRGIPVVKTSFLSPRTNVFGLVSAGASSSTAAGTPALSASTAYHYRIGAVMSRFGEIQASADATGTTGSSSTLAIDLTLPSTLVGPENSTPTHYKVYRGSSSTNQTLAGMVDAHYYDTNGVYRTTSHIIDSGTAFAPYDGTNAPASGSVGYFYANSGMVPLSAGYQSVYLMSRDPNFIVRPYVREMQPVNIYPTTASPDTLPFAFVADTTLAVRGPKYIGRLANVVASLDSTAGNGILPTTTSYSPNFIVD
jgi:hypothetical protein